MAIRAKIRPIGTSYGVILPKRELDARRLRPGDEVEIGRLHRVGAKDLFGAWREAPARVGEESA